MIESETENDVTIFHISGEVDLKSSPQLREKLQSVLKNKPKGIIIDMAECDYIDSSGIATIIEALQKTRAYKGTLAIASAGQRIKDIFEIAHLDGIFDIYPTLDEAKQAVK